MDFLPKFIPVKKIHNSTLISTLRAKLQRDGIKLTWKESLKEGVKGLQNRLEGIRGNFKEQRETRRFYKKKQKEQAQMQRKEPILPFSERFEKLEFKNKKGIAYRGHVNSRVELKNVLKKLQRKHRDKYFRITFRDLETGRIVGTKTIKNADELEASLDNLINKVNEEENKLGYGAAWNNIMSILRALSGEVTILAVKPPKGGCNPSEERVVCHGSLRLMNLKSGKHEYNNCGLAVVKHFCTRDYPKFAAIRKEFGFGKKDKLTPEQIQMVAEAYNVKMRIMDLNLQDLITGEMIDPLAETKIAVLWGEHYYVYCGCDMNADREVKSSYKKKDSRIRRSLLTFDLETRNDLESCKMMKDDEGNIKEKVYMQVPTLVSWTYKAAKHSRKQNESQRITSHAFGLDSVEKFLDWLILQANNGHLYNCKAHNGGNFDFYFIYNAIMKYDKYHDYFKEEESIIIKNSKILQISWCGHTFTDTYNFLATSLAKLCTDFNINEAKKDSFEIEGKTYKSMELCLMKNKLGPKEYCEWLERHEAFKHHYIEYCDFDTISLFEIWTKFKQAIDKLIIDFGLKCKKRLDASITAPSFVYKLWSSNNDYKCDDLLGKFEFIEEEKGNTFYSFINRGIIGGISHVGKPGYHPNRVACLDVNSLYPATMLNNAFPSGHIRETRVYMSDKLGVYFCSDIKMTPTAFVDIPTKPKSGSYDWTNPHAQNVVLCSADIERIRARGGSVTIDYGIYWTEKDDKVFKMIEAFRDEKNKQDKLKKDKDPNYNQSVREVCKLFLNSLFGKFLERSENFEYVDLTNKELHADEMDKYDVLYCNKRLIGKCKAEIKNVKYTNIGIFILGYSRDIIHGYFDVVGRENIIATETDSIYIDAELVSKFENMTHEKEYMKLVGKEKKFGELEVEYDDIRGSYFLGKKCYVCPVYENGEFKKNKYAFKGVPQSKLTLDTYKELYEKGSVKFGDITCFKRELFVDGETKVYVGTTTKIVKAQMEYKEY